MIKNFIFFIIFSVSSIKANAEDFPKQNFSIDVTSVSVSTLLNTVYIQAMPDKSYFIEPSALTDQRLVSLRYKIGDGDFKAFFIAFLKNLGYEYKSKNGVDFITQVKPNEAPIKLSAVEDMDVDIFYYRPKYRDGSYLVNLLQGLFHGTFTSRRVVQSSSAMQSDNMTSMTDAASSASPDSALGQIQQNLDQLLFYGSKKEVFALKKLLDQIDVKTPEVMVSALLYEVQNTNNQGSAFALAGSLLGAKLNFNFGDTTTVGNFVNLKLFDLNAVVTALNTDSRFKILSSPTLRVSSGSSSSFNVGDEVPTLGAVNVTQGAGSQQSIVYRSSGLIFNISANVRDEITNLKIDQELSTFVNTTSGVNNSPTLTKRQLTSNLNFENDEVIVLGGLNSNKKSSANSALPFFPSIFRSNTSQNADSQLLLFIQVKRI